MLGPWVKQGKLEVVKQETARVNIDILAIHELNWTGMGEFNSDDQYTYYCGQESLRKNGVVIIEQFNSSIFGFSGWGTDLDYSDIEWFVLEMNRDHSFVLNIAPKYCILDSFVDYDGYSISSKGLLPTVVDIMVIWIKFAHSGLF